MWFPVGRSADFRARVHGGKDMHRRFITCSQSCCSLAGRHFASAILARSTAALREGKCEFSVRQPTAVYVDSMSTGTCEAQFSKTNCLKSHNTRNESQSRVEIPFELILVCKATKAGTFYGQRETSPAAFISLNHGVHATTESRPASSSRVPLTSTLTSPVASRRRAHAEIFVALKLSTRSASRSTGRLSSAGVLFAA